MRTCRNVSSEVRRSSDSSLSFLSYYLHCVLVHDHSGEPCYESEGQRLTTTSHVREDSTYTNTLIAMAKEEKFGPSGDPIITEATASVVPNISQARLNTIIAGLWLCLFISALDTTIVTTALIKISSSYNALEQDPWLVTAYLLTYNCKPRPRHCRVLTY
jgi:hypothetical protein